jgi:hypothetical protein
VARVGVTVNEYAVFEPVTLSVVELTGLAAVLYGNRWAYKVATSPVTTPVMVPWIRALPYLPPSKYTKTSPVTAELLEVAATVIVGVAA